MTSNGAYQSGIGPTLGKTGIWGLILANLVGSYLLFREGLESIYSTWLGTPEYSHGILVPLITAYLIWQRKHEFHSITFSGSWAGFLLAVSGLLLFLIGELSALYILEQYAILVFLLGVVLSCVGWRVFKIIAVPLLLLFFSIAIGITENVTLNIHDLNMHKMYNMCAWVGPRSSRNSTGLQTASLR